MGDRLLLFGGTHETGDDVVSYNPADGRTKVVGYLPEPVGTTVIGDGEAAWVLGGIVHSGPATGAPTNQIVRFG